MKAVITVIGKDKPGIIYKVSKVLYEEGLNIEDISQTIMQGFFTMMMVVDLSQCATSFDKLGEKLHAFGEGRGLTIRIQREDIFDAMHKI